MCFRFSPTCAVCLNGDKKKKGNMSVQAALALFLTCVVLSCAEDSFQDTFDVNPGPDAEYEAELNGYKCKFAYQAQGGTNEKWQISIDFVEDGTAIMCGVARPGQASYLFFQKFKMSITGPGASIQQVEAVSAGSTPLDPEEYSIDKKSSSVSHVEGKFQHHLERLVALASIDGRSEL